MQRVLAILLTMLLALPGLAMSEAAEALSDMSIEIVLTDSGGGEADGPGGFVGVELHRVGTTPPLTGNFFVDVLARTRRTWMCGR